MALEARRLGERFMIAQGSHARSVRVGLHGWAVVRKTPSHRVTSDRFLIRDGSESPAYLPPFLSCF